MTSVPSAPGAPGSPSSSRGSWAVALLAVACVAALAAWWAVRAGERRALADALAPYETTPLPTADAPVDPVLADLGARVYEGRCAACHALTGEERLGPNLHGITNARDLGWIRRMVLAPDSMTRDDPIARSLLDAYGIPMVVAGGMDGSATLAVIEFLRRADRGNVRRP